MPDAPGTARRAHAGRDEKTAPERAHGPVRLLEERMGMRLPFPACVPIM